MIIYNKILEEKIEDRIWKETHPTQKRKQVNTNKKRNKFDWAHIVDLENKKIVIDSYKNK
jgi:hypothetical protein